MNQKRDIVIVLGMAFAALLCLLISVKNPRPDSRYFVMKESRELSYGCASLSCVLSEDYQLEEGENIEIVLVRHGGRFDIQVEEENGKMLYEGTNLDTGAIEITIPESAVYHLIVSGEKAQGSLAFQMK